MALTVNVCRDGANAAYPKALTQLSKPQQVVIAADLAPLQVALGSGARQHVAIVIVVATSLQAAGEWLWCSTTRATYSSSAIGSGVNTRESEV